MNHPILAAAFAEERRRRCPCGAFAQQHYGLCRECQVAAVWRPETTTRTRHHAIPGWTYAKVVQVRLFARAASLFQPISGKAAS